MRSLSITRKLSCAFVSGPPLLIMAFTIIVLINPMQLRHDDGVRFTLATDALSGSSLLDSKYSVIFLWILWVLIKIGRGVGNELLFAQLLVPMLLALAALLLTTSLGRGRPAIVRKIGTHAVLFSLAGAYVVSPNSDLFSASLLVIGYVLILDRPTNSFFLRAQIGVFALAIAGWNTPPHVVGMGIIGLILLFKRRSWLVVCAAVIASVLVVGEASFVNGHFSASKYGLEGGAPNVLPWDNIVGFGYPILFGVVGILFSLGRGLIFFVPGLWFVSEQPTKRTLDPTRALVYHTTILIPIYGTWWSWYGGVGFGPRFFIVGAFAGASLLALNAGNMPSVKRKAWISAALSLSTYVAVVGALIHIPNNTFNRCVDDDFYYEPICWYVAEFSPLLAPIWDDFEPLGNRGWILLCLGAFSLLSTIKALFEEPSRERKITTDKTYDETNQSRRRLKSSSR